MSIGAGLLGFIQGAADAGTKIAAVGLEEDKQIAKEERDAMRQQSLLDLQRRYASEETIRRNKALFDAVGPVGSADTPEKLGTLVDAGLLDDEKRSATLKGAVPGAIRALNLEGKVSEDDFFSALSIGIDPERLTPKVDPRILTDAATESLGRQFNMSPTDVQALHSAGILSTVVSQRGKNTGVSFVTVRSKQTGLPTDVPIEQLPELLSQRGPDGDVVFEKAEIKSLGDGKYALVTNTSITPIDRTDISKNFSPRVNYEADVQTVLDGEGYRKHDMDGVDPTRLGNDYIGAMVGPWDTFVSNVGSFTPINVGSRQIASVAVFADLRANVQAAYGVTGSRPLSVIMDNINKVLSTPSALARPFKDEKSIQRPLEVVRSTLRKSLVTLEDATDPDDLARIPHILSALGTINTLIVDRDIYALKVPLKGSNSEENLRQFSSINDLSRIDTEKLSDKERRLVVLWRYKLQLERGFNDG